MKQFRSRDLARTGLITLAAGALVFVTYGGQAYAQDGVSGSGSTSGSSTTKVESGDSRATVSPSQVNATSGSQSVEVSDAKVEVTADHANLTSIRDQSEKLREQMEVQREKATDRLEADKLKLCQAREKEIDSRMGKLNDAATDHLDVFSKIAERVENFYTTKGKTVSNYSALVADVNAKKAVAETAIAGIDAADTSFSCTGANPRLAAQQFKDAHAAVIKALQDYRTSIKNLIVAVKSVQSDTNEQSSATTSSSSSTTVKQEAR